MKRLTLLFAATLTLCLAACKKDAPVGPSSQDTPVPPGTDWKSFVEHYFDENMAYFGPTEEAVNYSGAYYTGDYTSPFKTYLNKSDAEIQAKLAQLWNHYFKGNNNSKIYFENGSEAYILDVANNDVRSPRMAYGMMIAVQTGHREEFDKLWKFAKNHMWQKSGQRDGYFAWQCATDGTVKSNECAPDAEMYFMASLLFASKRWEDNSYWTDAQYILDKMWSNGTWKLFNSTQKVIAFQPQIGYDYTEPAYDLPAFIELFARCSETQGENWASTIPPTRNHLYNSSNITSGLFAEISHFDGTPCSVSFNLNATKYMYEAMRCAMNFGMDYYLFGVDAQRQKTMAQRLIGFFERDDYQHARFNWDGSDPSEQYTLGEKGANAVACYALMGEPGQEEIIKKNLQKAWDAELMTGPYRYYDGLVHYLSMLHLCGSFKIWKLSHAEASARWPEIDQLN